MLNAVQMLAFAQSDRFVRPPAPRAQCKGLQARVACFHIRPGLIRPHCINLTLHTRIENVRRLAVVRSTVDYVLATSATDDALAPIIYRSS